MVVSLRVACSSSVRLIPSARLKHDAAALSSQDVKAGVLSKAFYHKRKRFASNEVRLFPPRRHIILEHMAGMLLL